MRIVNFSYAPKTVVLSVGERVKWTNADATNHTVTGDSGAPDLCNLDQGEAKSFTFRKTGRFAYHCEYHPFMHGTVIVKPG